MKVRLREISLLDLDRSVAAQVVEYIKTAEKSEGLNIDVRDKNLVWQVFDHGRKTKNADLKMLFLTLRRSVKAHVAEQFETNYNAYTRYSDTGQAEMGHH